MKLFGGLYFYEWVLLGLGVVLFIVLVVLMIGLVRKGTFRISFLLSFAIPLVMIGWPSIKSVQFKNGAITIEKATHQLEQDPTNRAARNTIVKELPNVAARASGDPRAAVIAARAQIALGDDRGAQASLEKALEADPQSSDARLLMNRIALARRLATLTVRAEQNPKDVAAKAQLEKTVAAMTQYPIASPTTLTSLARAHATLGDSKQALAAADKALAIDPNQVQAKQLKIRLNALKLQPK